MATAEISLDSIEFNFNQARLAAPKSKIMAVVKADAYGHGAVKVAQRLQTADAFAVARLSEAVELRQAGIQQPITLLSGVFHASQAMQKALWEAMANPEGGEGKGRPRGKAKAKARVKGKDKRLS